MPHPPPYTHYVVCCVCTCTCTCACACACVCVWTNHLIHKLLDGIVVTDVDGVQVDGVVDVCPHVVIMLHMVVKALWGGKDHVSQSVDHVRSCDCSPLPFAQTHDLADYR